MTSTTTAGVVTGYRYDGDNKRVGRSTGGVVDTKYEWDTAGGLPELALERDGVGAVARRWVQGPTGPAWMSIPTGAFTDPVTYVYHRDHLGSVTDLTTAGGGSVATYAYEPFGQQIDTDPVGAPANPMRFTGEYLDTETQDYHLRARQYDPMTGRFGAVDPVTPEMTDQWVNPYSYVGNMPGVYVDPSGMSAAVVASQVARAPRVALPGAVGRLGRAAGPAGTAVLALTAGLYIGSDINNWAYGDDLAQAAQADARTEFLEEQLLDRLTAANGLLGQCLALSTAQDSGKNEAHGDSGRELEKIQERLNELRDKLAELERTQGSKKTKLRSERRSRTSPRTPLTKRKGRRVVEKGKAPEPSEVLRWDGARQVGPFRLGDRLSEDLRTAFRLTVSSRSEVGLSRNYESGRIQDLSVWTWDDVITNVTSRTTMYFDTVDLIGLAGDEIVELFGVAPERDEIGDGLEHLLWVRPLVSADADVEVSVIDGVVRRVSLDNDDPIPDN